jgi:hypothetical protein
MLPLAMLFAMMFSRTASLSQNKAGRDEKLEMSVDTAENILPPEMIRAQRAYAAGETPGRGIVASFLINKGIQGIQSLIDNRKKKYSSDYSFAIKDESFYGHISTDGPFDPTGIRFKGFTVARVARGEDKHVDTLFIAKFSLDTSENRIREIMNNGIFRLRLDTFAIKSSRVRLPKHVKDLNLDFEITFLSSYIGGTGQINQDITVGKFLYSIRNAPLDPNDSSYDKFYNNIAKRRPECTGQSFLVPRSAGYYKDEDTRVVKQCWGQGLYSVKVSVKECSRNSFIDKVIIYSSGDILSVGNSSLQKKYGSSSPGSKSSGSSKPTGTKKSSK